MTEGASHTFTQVVKNEAGEKPCCVNRINHSANQKSRIQATGGKRTWHPWASPTWDLPA